jgi:bacteriocin biosynthesis cyclodehydratase domain-containing protein
MLFRMVLKLDSRTAVVWRDPFSLQFGVEPVRVILREVSTAEERMIAALATGVSRSGLTMIATSSGVGEREIASLLERLDGLLLAPTETTPQRCVAIVGRGPTVDRIADAVAVAGVAVMVGDSLPDSPCDLGVAVGHHVLDPESYGFWLRRDLPHLPVIFGEESVTVGPLVEPGTTACLYCLEHYRRDADASWSAIASQLWGRRARSETPLVSIEVAARVARLVLRRLDGAVAPAATSVRIDVETGEAVPRVWMPHPQCGCIGLPAGVAGLGIGGNGIAANRVSEGLTGTGSPHASDPPTRAAGAGGRA